MTKTNNLKESKKCFKCGETKKIDDFYTHKYMKDGHINKCKECTKIDSSMRDPQKVKEYEYHRSKQPHRKELAKAVLKSYRENNPARQLANQRLNRAVRRGEIIKTPCVLCGNPKSVGHHENYDHPLDVVWMCQRCHKLYHAHQKKEQAKTM